MKKEWMFSSLIVAGLLAAGPVLAQSGQGPGDGAALAARQEQAQRRAELRSAIIAKWSNHLHEVYKVDAEQWGTQMAPLFEQAPLETLAEAAGARTFDAMNNALLGQDASSAPRSGISVNGEPVESANLFGDADRDLVFVPVTPCRILDTRVAGGAILANTTRGFDVTAVSNYAFQGGDSSNCGGVGAAGSFAAAVINFTVVTPAAAGYITAFPFGATQPLAATVNYVAGDVRGNLAVVKLDQGPSANELSVYTFAQTHLVGDIVGYFINSSQPVFECVGSGDTIDTVAAGATRNTVAPACPAGYTQTATNCESSTWQMPFVYFADGTCSAQNNSSGSAQLRASRTCCRARIP
jgi:hypothetical protein